MHTASNSSNASPFLGWPADLRRLRLDPQGLISQDDHGILRRLFLAPSAVQAIAETPRSWSRLAIPASADNAAWSLLLKTCCDHIPEICLDQVGFLNRPLRIYFGIEPHCNLACRFCGPRSHHSTAQPVTQEEELFLLKQVADAGAFQVQLTGGEIGLRGPGLVRTVETAANLGLAVILATNGYWRSDTDQEAIIRQIAQVGNVIEVKVSIDGDRAFHDRMRGTGSYDQALKTLRLLSLYRLNPRISSTIFASSCNIAILDHLLSLARGYHTGLQLIPMRPLGEASEMPEEIPSRDSLYVYSAYAARRRQELGLRVTFNFDIFPGHTMLPRFDVLSPVSCGAPLWGCHMTHTGQVYPCGFVQDVGAGQRFLAGQVTGTCSLLSIWLRSNTLGAVRTAGKSATCQACRHYAQGCWGGCWVMAWSQTGALSGADPYCFETLAHHHE